MSEPYPYRIDGQRVIREAKVKVTPGHILLGKRLNTEAKVVGSKAQFRDGIERGSHTAPTPKQPAEEVRTDMPDSHLTASAPPKPLAKIIASRPVDATAARVTSAGPKGLESSKRIAQAHSDVPLPMRSVPSEVRHNLIGRSFGRFTVIGLSVTRPSQPGGQAWVCRCSCGQYEIRRSRSIQNTKNAAIDRCDRCRQVEYLRRLSERRQLGYYPDEQ